MTLNNKANIMNQLSKMNDDELNKVDIEVFLVSKASATDDLYNAKKENINNELKVWIKENIKKELNAIKFENENGEKTFHIQDYDYELTKKDFIAKLSLENEKDLKQKKEKLVQSLTSSAYLEDSEVKFQVIKLSYNSKSAYLIYYRGIKVSAMNKKSVRRIPTIRHREQLVIQEQDVVEFGGKIELMIIDDLFYIVSPRTLEYSFDFTDHISTKKDENLAALTNMKFFIEDPNVNVFIEKSNQYMISRRLAGIEKETLDTLEASFVERCKELKDIKERVPDKPEEKKEYFDKYNVLWPLYNHIDVFEKKVSIDPDKSIEPLIYFFADKIVESFLTKELRESL